MFESFTSAERLKFEILSCGVDIQPKAMEFITAANGDRPLSPADYASTSGVILELEDDVWVNAPIATYNANFVDSPDFKLLLDGDELFVAGRGLRSRAKFWLPPAYHGQVNADSVPYNSYAFTHADRVRISPIEGCALACKFCDLPYEFRYRTKNLDGLVESVRVALADLIQPAGHVLISGGAPRAPDFRYLQDAYEAVLTTFTDIPIDIMMVPMEGLLDVELLSKLGVNEFSINIEIFNRDIAKKIMRRKYDQGLDHYLDFLSHSADILGANRVRSMLLVGMEPMEDTLLGVRAIAERGCVPVLSPFRPDEATPLRGMDPPTAEFMMETYERAYQITSSLGVPLGPSCIPCGHNTLSFGSSNSGDAYRYYARPHMI